ncbi:hypothetical protein HYY71_07210, partial [Candidatus Woesearchaeota archaeon]|nr:hypothetical protein [Candidatus Woesearchaeota archaeon]
MRNKNSQISLFIIIGILVLISFGVLFYYANFANQKIQGAKVDVNYERNSVNLYIKECVIQAAKPLIEQIAGKGGAFNPKSGIIWNGTELNTLAIYKTGTGYENTLLLRQDIEKELAERISNNLKNCINFSIFKEKGYTVQEGKSKIETALNDEALIVLLDYPLELTIGSTKLNFEDFSITLDTSLGLLYRASINIVNSEVQDGYFDKEDVMLRHEGLMIEKHKPYPNIIYV